MSIQKLREIGHLRYDVFLSVSFHCGLYLSGLVVCHIDFHLDLAAAEIELIST